jgi:tetratricopeptide (TPR) repeat protein
MNEYDEIQVSEWLRNGVTAAKAGRRAEARELLMRVIEADEHNEQAWLWLSGVVDTDEDRLICLENVLTLNPDNVQARAGLRWLQEREARGEGREADVDTSQPSIPPDSRLHLSPSPQPSASQESDLFMTPDGCVYCGLVVSESDSRCPHCGGRLISKQFKREERSGTAYLLHAFWIMLSGINLADFFLIGYIWGNVDNIVSFLKSYLEYAVGPVVAGTTSIETFIEPDLLVQIVRFTNAGLAALGLLVALGLFLRWSPAHPLALALITLQLVIGILLFALGFTGYLIAAIRALYTVMLTTFLFQTIDDYIKEERREQLAPDRHLLNDADYYTRGRLYEKWGMWAKALLHLRRAVAINPDRDTYLAALARAYAHLGRYETALEQIDAAIRVSRTPEEWEPLRETIAEAQRRATAGVERVDLGAEPG